MEKIKSIIKNGEKYFLTPVCLVPNGRAHLGHIAGPLLKMDVLRRFLIILGADVTMVSLSDSHESHVTIRANELNSTPEETANHFHKLIQEDLNALNIGYDDLINPLDDEWDETYTKINYELIESIIDNGNAQYQTEKVPHLMSLNSKSKNNQSYLPKVGDPIVSGWLKGKCPTCEQPLVGFFCESCGGHFKPSEMKQPETAHFDGDIKFKSRSSLFLSLTDGSKKIYDHLSSIGTRPDFLHLAENYLSKNNSTIRLTVPSTWGLDVSHLGLPENEVIWSYSSLLYGCHLVAGERYKQLNNTTSNPFDNNSNVKTIVSFGIDNSIPFLVGATGCGLAQNKYKPVDSYIVNHFYDLDGAKFSTSRGHVIWGSDIVKLGGATPDIVRAYICKSTSEFNRSSFEIDEFINFHNSLSLSLKAKIEDSLSMSRSAKELDKLVLEYLSSDIISLSAALDSRTFDLSFAFKVVESWLNRSSALSKTPDSAMSWLLGLSIIATPVMPTISEWILTSLFNKRDITLDEIFNKSSSFSINEVDNPIPLRESPLQKKEFNACLPAHLR